MKRFLTVLLVSLFLTLAVCSQDIGDAWRTYSMHGPVRSFRTETADILQKDGKSVEGARIISATAIFNEDGERDQLDIYDTKGNLVRRIASKYEAKRLVEILNYDGAGHLWLRGTHSYDVEGRSKEDATYNGDGSLRSKTTFKRDAQGRVIESDEMDAKGSPMDIMLSTYNEAGEKVTLERSYYDPPGTISFKEVQHIPEKRTEHFAYNSDGSLSVVEKRVDKQINSYAPDGSLVKSTILTDAGKLPDEMIIGPNGAIRKETQTPDEIDSHGNWTKQTKWVTDSQGTRPVKVTYRTITYF